MADWKKGLEKFAQKAGMKISPDTKEKSKSKKGNKMKRYLDNVSPTREEAYAPYNFVPLNESVVKTEPFLENDEYHEDKLTGYIDCDLKTLTPVYIRGCLTEFEVKEGKEAKDKSDFFSPNGGFRIPGSSLRGMIRTLVEIVSWSKFNSYENKNLYFRGLADKSNLNKYYDSIMRDPTLEGVGKYKIYAGYLKKEGLTYFIIPAEKNKNNKQFQRFDGAVVLEPYKFKRLNSGDYIIRSGRKVNPNHRDKDVWQIYLPDSNAERIKLSDEDVLNYQNDIKRGAGIDLIKETKKHEYVPCFYILRKGRIAFGHTALFRIAYENSIEDLIPSEIADDKKGIDITEAIFGMSSGDQNQSFASRIFFEDALLKPDQKDFLDEERIPSTLLSPNPTTFQHYLTQKSDKMQELNHYDSPDTTIRGYKLYWHKDNKSWFKPPNQFNPKIDTKIKVIKLNKEFSGRIRFENLSAIELGALLFALRLPEGCNHKIGMGKPLGLGSIKITPTLVLSDRKERYRSLFDGNKWALPPKKDSKCMQDYINDFARFILGKIGDEEKEGAKSLWDTYRLRQLKTMLDVETGKQLEKQNKIRYMQIQCPQNNEFKDRRILPIPEKVQSK